MTNDKTVTMSRELAERLLYNLPNEGTKSELRALLAAPVVERQEPVAYADPKSFENFNNLAHLGGLYAHEWMWANPAPGLKPLYTSPPAPVAVVVELPEWGGAADFHFSTPVMARDSVVAAIIAAGGKVKELNK